MKVVYSEPSLKQLKKIGKYEAKRIINYMKEVENLDNSRVREKPLLRI